MMRTMKSMAQIFTKNDRYSKEKMPFASLIKYDFSKGLPVEIKNNSFDYIISTYALHHLDDEEKRELIKKT